MSQLQVTGEAKIRDIQGPVVSNSGVITALDGDASQYVRGDGTLADFPTSTGGGSSVSYYLNSSVSQGTIGGVAYRQLGKTPISGAGTDIAISANGYVASYITDSNDPALLEVPAGNFNCEFYFSVNNNTGNPFVYAEVYKYDGTTFTLLGTSVGVPEYINQGTVINPYYFAVPVAVSALTVTDRIAIRIYVNVDGRTVTLHTENNHLCQVVTTFSKGLISLNNLTRQNQFFGTGTSGTDFNISSATATHTFNIPSASATNRGLITTGAQTIAGSKTFNATLYGVDSEFSGSVLSPIFSVINGANVVNLQSLATATRDIYLPDASGTLALTSNLSSYVPYTGATANVDLGTNSLFAYDLFANGNGTNNANLYLKQGTPALLIANGYSNILATGTKIGFQVATSAIAAYYADLQFSSLTAQRTFTLPDLSGTLALLEGTQTFTGGKTFSFAPRNDGGILLKNNVTTGSSGYVSVGSNGAGLTIGVHNSGTTYFHELLMPNSVSYNYTFPAATGTLALTSDLGAYVTLATTQTISGIKTLTSNLTIAKADTLNVLTLSSTNTNVISFITSSVQKGEISVNSSNFQFNSATTNGYIFKNAAANNVLSITDAGVTTLIGALSGTSATFSGNVAIGVGTTSADFDRSLVVFGTNPSYIVQTNDNTGYAYFHIKTPSNDWSMGYDGSNNFKISNSANPAASTKLTIASTGAATFSSSITAVGATFTGTTAVASVGGTSQMRIDRSGAVARIQNYDGGSAANISLAYDGGNVGIGTSSPARPLTVMSYLNDGAISTGGNMYSNAYFGNGGIMIGTQSTTGNGVFMMNTNKDTIFGNWNGSTNAERMRITSGGGVLIGKTAQDNTTRGIFFRENSWAAFTNNGDTVVIMGRNTNNGTILEFQYAGSVVGTISTNSNSLPSDKNFKKDISDISIGLNLVNKLRPVHYRHKMDNDDEALSNGIIAQELEQALLECGIEKNSLLMLQHKPNEKENESQYWVDYTKMIPILIKSIQEQTQIIKNLEARIVSLENK